MRIGLGLAIGSVALAAAVGTSWSASPPPAKSVSPPPTLSDISSAARPKGAGVSTPQAGVGVAGKFTADECKKLGGSVYTGADRPEIKQLCASGAVCNMTDNRGVEHTVCLDVAP